MIEPEIENLLLKARKLKIKIADEISEKILKLYLINKTLFNKDVFDFKYKYNIKNISESYKIRTVYTNFNDKIYIEIYNYNDDRICDVNDFEVNLKYISNKLSKNYDHEHLMAINKMFEDIIEHILIGVENFVKSYDDNINNQNGKDGLISC